jgi:hypothetical protein
VIYNPESGGPAYRVLCEGWGFWPEHCTPLRLSSRPDLPIPNGMGSGAEGPAVSFGLQAIPTTRAGIQS